MRFSIPSIIFFCLLIWLFVACSKRKEVSCWNFIDANSIAVFEANRNIIASNELDVFGNIPRQNFVVSVQALAKNSFDLLYVIKISEKEYSEVKDKLKWTSRQLSGVEISELKKNGKVEYATACISGFVLLSKSSLLIENAIRIYNSSAEKDFRTQNFRLFDKESIKTDAGKLWINHSQLGKTQLPLLVILQKIPMFRNFALASVLEFAKNKEPISLNGFTIDSIDHRWGLGRFKNQTSVKIEAMRFVPNGAKAFIHYGISDSKIFFEADRVDPVSAQLGDEIAVCVLENDQPVVFVKIKDSYKHEGVEYTESYAGYDIQKIGDKDMLSVLKPLIPTNEYSYLVFKDSYLFLSESTNELKLLIDAIEMDETWGRSVDFQQFFAACLQEGNVSVFFTTATMLDKDASTIWKGTLDSLGVSSTMWGSIQFNSLGDRFYTGVNFSEASVKQPEQRKPERRSFELNNTLAAAYLVKNHAGGANELLVQDSTYKVFLFSRSEGVQWVYPLPEKIEQMQQVDYLKNGRLQYLITTKTAIYLIDRLGRDVQGFPVKKNYNVRFSEVVDYDKSKNYRLVITSGDRDIFILDKSMNELDGWMPKTLDSKIVSPPKHYRIGGKDYFVVLTENGKLHVFNRRGEYEAGYPMQVSKNKPGNYFLEPGNSLLTSFIYLVSETGEVQKIGLNGKRSAENLVRGKNSVFYLVPTSSGKSDFYYFRIDFDKLAVFDNKNQLVFERQNPGSQSLVSDAVKSSDGLAYFCFYDEEQKLSYVFNSKGSSVLNKPMETTIPPVFEINTKAKQINAFAVYENTISVTSID